MSLKYEAERISYGFILLEVFRKRPGSCYLEALLSMNQRILCSAMLPLLFSSVLAGLLPPNTGLANRIGEKSLRFRQPFAQPIELAYDDGESEGWEGALALYGSGAYAVRFTPPLGISKITAIRYYIYLESDQCGVSSERAAFNVLIMNADREPIYDNKAPKPTNEGWFKVDLSNENIIVSGEFYAAMEATAALTERSPCLGMDTTNPDGRSFHIHPHVEAGEWRPYEDEDLMIRVTVEPISVTTVAPTVAATVSSTTATAVSPTTSPAGPTVRQFVTCKGVDETKTPYEALDITDTFLTTDKRVYALLVLDNLEPPVNVTIVFYAPVQYGYKPFPSTHRFEVGPTVSYAVYIDISEIAAYTGEWVVEAWVWLRTVDTVTFNLGAGTATIEGTALQTYGPYVVAIFVLLVIAVVVIMARRKRRVAPPAMPPAAPARVLAPAPPTVAVGWKFCINCGTRIPEMSKFCETCGSQQP